MESQKLFELLCYLHRQLSRENKTTFSEHGLSHVQLHTILYLDKCAKKGEKVCQRDIEKLINLRPSSVSSLLTILERENFIRRTVSEGDARTKNITLTEKGQGLCEKNRMLLDNADQLICSALTEEEQETMRRLLTKIIDSINKQQEVKS